jgi:DNA mismatch endonuclease, patch repair protein
MAAVKSKDTTPEMVVRRMVHGLGFRYRLHVKELPGTPDLVLPRLGKIVVVNGCFWHGHACGACRMPEARRAYWVEKIGRNAERDRRTQRRLRRLGWKVLVVWECETKSRGQERLLTKLLRFLRHSQDAALGKLGRQGKAGRTSRFG